MGIRLSVLDTSPIVQGSTPREALSNTADLAELAEELGFHRYCIGVANTMVISVLERKREIGLRRALGAHRGQVRTQFLTESVVLCLLGGPAGVVLGLPGTVVHAAAHGWPAVIPAEVVGAGLGAAVLTGVVAGVYPAVRASRLTPTEALAAP